RGSQLRIASR
nr:Chain B, Alkaline phosphatase peptide [Escherichia coli K-12]